MKLKFPTVILIYIVTLFTVVIASQLYNSNSRYLKGSINYSDKMSMRLELFTSNIDKTVHFYQEVLGFKSLNSSSSNYHPIQKGQVVLGIGLLESLGSDHHFNPNQDDIHHGYGVEIVLEVEDIHFTYQKARLANVELESELQKQPWGLTDFRLVDPNGYYIRVTSKD